jgi:hypothetical protein
MEDEEKTTIAEGIIFERNGSKSLFTQMEMDKMRWYCPKWEIDEWKRDRQMAVGEMDNGQD